MPDSFVILSVILLVPVVFLMRFIGCGSFSGTDGQYTPPVAITPPPPISLGPGQAKDFTAQVDDNTAVTWSATAGNISSTGPLTASYKAPDPFDQSKDKAMITASKKPDMKTGAVESGSITIDLANAVVSLDPMAAIAKPGQVVPFTAKVENTDDMKFTWGGVVPDMPQGPTAKYKAPDPYVLGSAPVSISVASHGVTATATVSLVGNGAVFVKKDSATQGSWKRAGGNVYGKDGYGLASSPNIVLPPPGYLPGLKALLNAPSPPSSLLENTYAPKDARDLVDPSNLANSIAAVWYTAPTFKQFQFDLPFGDSKVHQLAVYSAIWDGQARAQIISILDGDNPSRTLDTQKLSGFDTGVYLVWNVSGHIVLQVTNDTVTNPASPNAVISGVFFG
jgi:hypothetical protein